MGYKISFFIMAILMALCLVAGCSVSYEVSESAFEGTPIENDNVDDSVDDVLSEESEPPHFIMLFDRKYKTGTDLSLFDLVYAEDVDGNDITENITIVSNGGYDSEVAGDYEITYRVTDDRQAVAEEKIIISVGDYDHNDYGFTIDHDTLKELIAREYFGYNILSENEAGDIDALTSLTSPTSFGAAYDDGACSCFLFRVTENNLYFFTNKHCPVDSSDTLCLYAYDDSMTEIPTSDITYLKYHPEYDAVANGYLQYDQQMFVVPISYFDIDDLLCYREVHIDMSAFESLQAGDMFLMNTQSWRRCQKDIVMENTVLFTDCYEQTAYHYEPDNIIPAMSHMVVGELKNAVGSCSGSPCFDRYGNFLGFIWGTTYANGPELIYLDQFVPLPSFLKFTKTIYFH